MAYSQNSEEIWIKEALAEAKIETGRFIDVGAYNPTIFSNTRALVERGWSGVYVEPAPINFNSFLTEYRDKSEIVLVNAAIAIESRLIEFHDSGGDALSSSSRDHLARWTAQGVRFRKYLTKTITWAELFDQIGSDFTVLSLDVEGANLELFQCLPLDRLTALKVVVVEHGGFSSGQDMIKRARAFGFKHTQSNGENILLIRP